MASSGSSNPNSSTQTTTSPTFSILPNLSQLFKLEGPNYLAWVSQFHPILRGNDLQGFVDGIECCPPQLISDEDGNCIANPAYAAWQRKDQLLLSWIISSLAPSIVSSMYGVNTSHEAWTALAAQFASQSKSRVSHLKRQLQTLQQGTKMCTEYLSLAKQLADQLSAAGKPVEDDDLISYVIGGLSPSFNTFVTVHSFTTQDREMTFSDFQSELLNHEMLLESQQQQNASANTGTFAFYSNKPGQSTSLHQGSSNFRKPRFPPRPNSRYQQYPSRGNSTHQPFAQRTNPAYPSLSHRNQSHFPTGNQQPAPVMNRNPVHQQTNPEMNTTQGPLRTACQICGRNNHSALDCFHRMDYSFQGRHPPGELAAMVAHLNDEFGTQKWLADSGANTHVTADAANIHNPQPFEGTDVVGVGNGAGLHIQNSGSSNIHPYTSNHQPLFLKDILHCPKASANLLSINKFCIDNNCWFALTGSHFFVKDNHTGQVLLKGPSENGLYPIPLHPKHLNKWKGLAAYVGVKTNDLVWHQRLGHPSSSVIQHLLQKHQLPIAGSLDKTCVRLVSLVNPSNFLLLIQLDVL